MIFEKMPSNKLIVALDLPSIKESMDMVDQLHNHVSIFKIGFGLWAMEGFDRLVNVIQSYNKQIFFDAKLYDIPETVERAVRIASLRGFSFITVHYNQKVIEAAVRGRGDTDLKIMAVTVLTSSDKDDLLDMGYRGSISEMVTGRAKRAMRLGADGMICSATDDIAYVRSLVGKSFLIATPGVRPAGISNNDHSRSGTPLQAIQSGADYIIVGRPIYQAENPALAAQNIISEIS